VRWASILAAFLIVVLLVPPVPAQEKDWTILVYMDADNNLEPVGIVDFLELSSVGSDANVNVVVQIDRTPGFDTSYGDWTDARRFYVTAGMTPLPQNSLQNLGEANMADPATLAAFVSWGVANYPARHVFLVLWDHGDGWQGVVVDDDPVANDRLTAVELRTAFDSIVATTGTRIDLLGNDACRMTTEIMYELAPYVDYFVGSEKDEPLDGWPYDDLLASLVANPTMSPDALAATLVDRYVESYEGTSQYSVALSAVNAAALRPLLAELDAFVGELAIEEPYFTAEVLAARAATERYENAGTCCGDEYDLYHFIENVLANAPSRRVERLGIGALRAIDVAVVHERHWDNPSPINGVPAKNAHGLSLWFPTIGGDPGYGALSMSQDGTWDEFLTWYAIGSRPQVAANASATAEDADGDGSNEALVLEWNPAADGVMAVDLYRDGTFDFALEFPAVRDRRDVVRVPMTFGGVYEVSFYLLSGGDLVNLTVVRDLVIHEWVGFRGFVRGPSGDPMSGVVVQVTNLRTNANAQATTTANGSYSIVVRYPDWFRDGDPVALEVRSTDQGTRLAFPASVSQMAPDRSFVNDITLSGSGAGVWIAAMIVFAALFGVTLAGMLVYRRRFERFKNPP